MHSNSVNSYFTGFSVAHISSGISGIQPEMSSGTPNPNPRATVWCILGLALFLVLIVGWLAVSTASSGYFQLSSTGGSLPAAFLFIAVLVGIASVAIFVHRNRGHHPK
jgi:ABC-type multidrug transport system permease subunit